MWRLIGAGVVGGLIGSYATHLFTLSRERDSGRRDRKRNFRNFIVRFKSDAVAEAYYPKGHLDRPTAFAVFYQQEQPELRSAAANIETDLSRKQRAKFDQLVNTAAGFTGAEANAADGKKRVLDSLDAILQFLDQ
jgi:hypothetical protein